MLLVPQYDSLVIESMRLQTISLLGKFLQQRSAQPDVVID
jgi:hypothetical protein